MSGVILRHYRPGDEHGILALFNAVFAVGNPDFVPRTLTHWNWAFRDNPEGHDTMVAEDAGRIVAQYTALPARWRFPHGIGRGVQAVDSCVAEDHRRSLRRAGVFLRLGEAWFDHYGRPDRDQIVYGFPNPQAFRIGTRRLGYLPVRSPQPEQGLPAAAAAAWDAPGLHVTELADVPAEVDALEEALAPRAGIACVRDARYLSWRYARCPTTRYRILRAESAAGGLRGLLVHTLGWHGERKDIVPLVDWLIEPGDLPVWRALLGEAARAATACGLRELLAWTPPPSDDHADLAALGFAPRDSRFHLCIRIFCDSFDLDEAVRRWTVRMGDSDIY